MSLALELLILAVSVSTGLCFVRLLRGPSVADRVNSLDQITVHVVALASLYVILTEQLVLLDAAIVAALLSFLGTVAFARYLEQGREEL